jgi:hypothetical protein
MQTNPSTAFRAALLATLILAAILPAAGLAQGNPYQWSTPVKIDERREPVSEMSLAADSAGGLHLFWNPLGEPNIFYSQWDGDAWSYPVDILSGGQVRGPSAVVDSQGYLHLVWTDSFLTYYSQAPADQALSAQAWLPPVAVAESGNFSQVISAADGTLHIAFPGPGNSGPGLITSQDGGLTWSDPIAIAPTSQADSAAEFTRAAVSTDGAIHVVWTEFQLPLGWPPLGVFYSRSTDGGKSWSNPLQFAGADYDQINVAAFGDQDVHVAWNGVAGIGGRYHSYSTDSGLSWSSVTAVTPPGQGGTEGVPQLAVDANGVLHLATTYDQRVWYSAFEGQTWTVPMYIPSGDEAGIPPLGQIIDPKSERFIERVALAINQGNQLHLVFWDERPARQVLNYWYTTRQTSAAPIPPTPFPTRAAVSTPTPTPDQVSLPTIQPYLPEAQGNSSGSQGPANPIGPVLIGVLPAVLVLVIVFLLRYSVWRRR